MYISTIDMGEVRSKTNLTHIFNNFGIPSTFIEVGCFEGVTTCWVADTIGLHNKEFKVYAIDPHTTLNNNHAFDFDLIKNTFLYNKKLCAGNIEYINKYSYEGLIDLIKQKEVAELIFIDGDHSSAAVLEDMILSWRLLPIGGVMLCDDSIGWKLIDGSGSSPVQMSPRMGIEMFIQANWHKIELIPLPDSFQTAFKKIKE
jgi:hypothetical protein